MLQPFGMGVGLLVLAGLLRTSTAEVPSSTISLSDFLGREPRVLALLDRRVSVAWKGVTLGDICVRLRETSGVPFWLAHDVDPTQSIDVAADDVSILNLAAQVAHERGLEVHPLGHVMLLASPATGSLARNSLASGRVAGARWKLADELSWPRLTTARALLEQVARDADLKVKNPDAVRHDLLPAGLLPAMPTADRLTLVLLRTGQSWRLSGRAGDEIEVIPLGEQRSVSRQYSLNGKALQAAAAAVAELPDGSLQRKGLTSVLNAAVDQHEAFARACGLLTEQSAKPAAEQGEQRFTLRLQGQTVRQVLQTLASRLGKSLDVSSVDAGVLDRPLTLDVKQVTLDQLLATIVDQAGLQIDASDATWRVTPR